MTTEEYAPGTPLDDVDAVTLPSLIPHRPPFLLIDRVVDIRAFERATGIKSVSLNEPHFQGHFPGDPIMPGVLIVECMAQTAAVLVVASRSRQGRGDGVYFLSIDEARFRRPVRPGHELRLDVEKLRQRMGFWRFSGKATVDGDLVTEAVFTAKLFEA
ncbi:MAG: 3-hydroxyacyl-ACP dehydratase FabZ [Geminicoccaceae bacterium]|nr:3-hydroxyacyl-ACP dehydratase FabZ [Geminicoccaceae bacterium]